MQEEPDRDLLRRFAQGDREAFEALFLLLLMPLGYALARSLEVLRPVQWDLALPMAPVGATVYYLAWKYLVGFLNQEVGIA